MRFGGPEIVTSFNKRAAGLFFNPFVETDLGVLKYGVISTERAVDDLENWTSLYLSGRLHKPVKVKYQAQKPLLSSPLLVLYASASRKLSIRSVPVPPLY